jgi:uncharacterized protein YdeI (YjbR/CyaY-like superfamily)
MIPFEDRKDIVRDPFSKAILSRDKVGFLTAKKNKEQESRYIKLEKEVNQLKNDTHQIKEMLQQLLNRGIK